MEKKITRRDALKTSLGIVIGTAGVVGATSNVQADCEKTVKQTEGPFYPENLEQEKDNDLTLLKGRPTKAEGEIIYICGTVRDENCNLLKDAVVEIWQACKSGRYNHSGDPSSASLDPNFQYWGKYITDEQGRYSFKTIIPGSYMVNKRWRRPPHVHFKVSKRGYFEITSQMYFAGNSLNEKDGILQRLPKQEQERVVVNLESLNESAHTKIIEDFGKIENKACVFDVVLKSVSF